MMRLLHAMCILRVSYASYNISFDDHLLMTERMDEMNETNVLPSFHIVICGYLCYFAVVLVLVALALRTGDDINDDDDVDVLVIPVPVFVLVHVPPLLGFVLLPGNFRSSNTFKLPRPFVGYTTTTTTHTPW
jgi:hypothetical protein